VSVVGRFAPSPTGPLHLGNLRTALLAWRSARAQGGRFLMRIEDLDPVASQNRWIDAHLADLAAVGIDWDDQPLRQSTRRAEHTAAVRRLTDAGLTYPCFCTRAEIRAAAQAPHGEGPLYPGTCRHLTAAEQHDRVVSGRTPALRLRADARIVTAHDRRHGDVTMTVDDFVVQRADGVAAYNVAVVVDDAFQGVTEVMRGDDLLPTTPRQVLVAELLDLPVPAYEHVPLLLGDDGERMAKRHHGATLADQAELGRSPADVARLLLFSL
jgi:glutamyl-tRNA synthetase